jgi:hypothetical protein
MRILFTILLTIILNSALSQTGITWSTEIDIASSNSGNLHPRIVSDRTGNPLVIWGKISTDELYFTRWSDTAFITPVILNPLMTQIFTASWAGPDIASHGDTVYIVYKLNPEDTTNVQLIRSFDGGATFSVPIDVDHLVDSVSRFPTVATDSLGHPVVAFMKFEAGFLNAHYVVCRSFDYGSTFAIDNLASMYSGANVCDCCPGALVCSGNLATLLYRDNFNDFRTIWCGTSTDNANTFPFGMQVDNTSWFFNACPSSGPDAIIIGDSVYSVFMSGATGADRCYFTPATISGTWPGPTVMLGDSIMGIDDQNFPRIANFGNKAGIVCRQTYNGNGQLVLYFTEDIYNGFPDVFDTIASGNITNGDIIITDEAIHIVWQDDNSETVKYRKGSFSTTTVKNDPSINKLLVYPSPAHNQFSIQLINSITHVNSIELIDPLGKIINQTFDQLKGKATCYLYDIKAGCYIVRIRDSNSRYYFSKVIVY